MELERDVLVFPTQEVPVVEGEVVLAIRADCGVGSKAIARAVGVARITVRRYLRQSIETEGQLRRAGRRLTEDRRFEARALYAGPAGGNAVVVQRLLAERGPTVSVRTIERSVSDLRRERRVAQLATVRIETALGDQLQIDFGQKDDHRFISSQLLRRLLGVLVPASSCRTLAETNASPVTLRRSRRAKLVFQA